MSHNLFAVLKQWYSSNYVAMIDDSSNDIVAVLTWM